MWRRRFATLIRKLGLLHFLQFPLSSSFSSWRVSYYEKLSNSSSPFQLPAVDNIRVQLASTNEPSANCQAETEANLQHGAASKSWDSGAASKHLFCYTSSGPVLPLLAQLHTPSWVVQPEHVLTTAAMTAVQTPTSHDQRCKHIFVCFHIQQCERGEMDFTLIFVIQSFSACQ